MNRKYKINMETINMKMKTIKIKIEFFTFEFDLRNIYKYQLKY